MHSLESVYTLATIIKDTGAAHVILSLLGVGIMTVKVSELLHGSGDHFNNSQKTTFSYSEVNKSFLEK